MTACILCKVVRGIQVVVEVASALQCCNTVQQAMTAAATTAIMGEKNRKSNNQLVLPQC